MSGVYNIMNLRRGCVFEENPREGTPIVQAKAMLHAQNSLRANSIRTLWSIAISNIGSDKSFADCGLKKSDLMKSKSGKLVSKKSHAAGKKAYQHIKDWTVACQKARKELGLKGFVAIKKGSALYKKAKELYTQ